MSKFNGRKIRSATLHEGLHTPETGALKTNLTSSKINNSDKVVNMIFWDDKVEISAKGKTILVPFTGFKQVVLEDEEAKKTED